MTAPNLPKLAMAIVAAQTAAEMTEKDGTNNFHKYDYVSAEQLIHKCSAWLNGAGLALVPLMSSLLPFEAPAAGGDDRDTKGQEAKGRPTFILQRHYLLVHDSGECLELCQDWPVVPEKGRPTDKAVAVADTSSLAYMLRNLVLVPRVDEGEDFNEDQHRGQPRKDEPRRDEPRKDPPRKEEPREERKAPADKAPDKEDAHDRLWVLLRERVEALPEVVDVTNDNLAKAAEHLFKRPFNDLTDDEVAEHTERLSKVSDERLHNLVGGFFVPF